MANIAGFTVETPDEVQRRIQQQRTAMLGSNNPLMIQQSLFGNALDSLFGNPEVRQKTLMFNKVNDALQAAAPGKDALETEINRMYSVRDAVGNLDPNVSEQINARLVALEDERLQRNKLIADEGRANVKATDEHLAAGLARTAADLNLLQDVNDSQTWFNPNGPGEVQILKSDAERQATYRKAGWVTHAPSTETEAGARLGKKAADALDADLISADKALMDLGRAGANYKPEFSSGFFQVAQGTNEFFSRWSADGLIPDAIKQSAPQYRQWRSQTFEGFNQYVHNITGAAMNKGEIDRYLPVVPTASDSTQTYLAKSRAAMEKAMALRAYVEYMKGMNYTPEQIKGESIVKNEDKLKFSKIDPATLDAAMMHAFGVTGRGEAAAPGTKSKTKSGVTFTIER